MKQGEDYYFNEDGLMVLTGNYLRKRGYCCGSACKHCPYQASPTPPKEGQETFHNLNSLNEKDINKKNS